MRSHRPLAYNLFTYKKCHNLRIQFFWLFGKSRTSKNSLRFLGVNRLTTYIIVRAELSHYPLWLENNSRICSFIDHVNEQLDTTSLASQALKYESSINNRTTFTSKVTEIENFLHTNKLWMKPMLFHPTHVLKCALIRQYLTHWEQKTNFYFKSFEWQISQKWIYVWKVSSTYT